MASFPQGTILYTFSPKHKTTHPKEGFGLRKRLWWGFLVLITGLTLVWISFLAIQYQRVSQLKSEVSELTTRHQKLVAEYKTLTSKEIVYAKARTLGLSEPRPEQITRLK